MKINFLLLLLFSFTSVFYAQKLDLSKSILTIPDSLKTKANIVIRNYETTVAIKSYKNMVISKNMFYTILNKHGNKEPFFIESFDKHTSIENVKIRIYNSLGKLIKKVKNKEIHFSGIDDGFSLYTDDKVMYYEHLALSYPYSIEISYQVKTSNTAFIRDWFITDTYNQSVQKNTITINYPENLKLNFKESNFGNFPIQKSLKKNSITYSVSNIKALRQESLSPSFAKIIPHVSFALNKFSLAGQEGNANNWQEFGKWMYDKLLKGRNFLSEETKNHIKVLVKNETDPLERAKIVYKYMQDKTRYVSVQIGIGGWKPMKANEVNKLGYGDCKALVNYTQSLLAEANVESLYTIVYSGNKKNIKKDLVSVQGNHAILMLPTKKDTVWLECTSQKFPFGLTGSTDDRDVLVVTPNGGKIVHTNTYNNLHNYQKTIGNYTINEQGDINGELEIKSTGKQYNWSFDIAFEKEDDQIIAYKKKFSNIINANITSIAFIDDKETASFTEKLKLNAANYAEQIGNDILLPLNAFNVYNRLPKRTINRKYPLVLKYGFIDEDRITINIPSNYKVAKLPAAILIENKFGKYSMVLNRINVNQLIYKRVLQINEGTYPKTDYMEYRKFIKEIIKYDKLKIILQKL